MCGIAGALELHGAHGGGLRADHAADGMLAALEHRGPDAVGRFAAGAGWVGQTRLAIVDLPGGDPPVTNEDATIGVALNGELYDFARLRAELAGRGHRLATHGDTEVLAHLAEELEPVELLRALDGMFAFAVWDARRGRLVLGRDRFGKKPLHVWSGGGTFAFASEIGALLRHPAVPRRPAPDVLGDYLTFGCVPSPRTMYEGIGQLPPGHVLVVEPGGTPRVLEAWAPPLTRRGEHVRGDLEALAGRVRGGLETAVRRRLVADVEVGAFLSGGIDSSAVVGLMAAERGPGVPTFTIGFEDDDGFDERPFARAVAERWGCDHHEWVVRPDAAALVERLVEHHDAPFGDSSALPTWLLSELTAGHVRVALCGDGGDELFAGYERMAAATALARYGAVVPHGVRAGVRRLAERAPGLDARGGLAAKARRALLRSDLEPHEALLAWVSYVGVEERAALTGGAGPGPGRRRYDELWAASAGAHPLDRVLDLNLRTYLLDDLLPKVDRTSMAHGLEVRAPFLDRELAELALALPPGAKLRGTQGKRVLRAAVADLLPAGLLDRPKRGFGVPLDRWFREDLAPLATSTLGAATSRVGEHLHRPAVERLLADHLAGRRQHGHALWTLLTLELFLRREGW